jgi:hypothetical protein
MSDCAASAPQDAVPNRLVRHRIRESAGAMQSPAIETTSVLPRTQFCADALSSRHFFPCIARRARRLQHHDVSQDSAVKT